MNSFDAGILHFLNHFALRSFIWDALVTSVEQTDLLKGAALTAAFMWVWFRRNQDKGRDREFVTLSVLLSLASVLLARGLALALPFRERPLRATALHFQMPYTMTGQALYNWSSFPSDHAAFFFTGAICLLFISRRLGILALFYAFIVICFPRLYLGIHYPSDIITGAALGTAMAFLVKVDPLRTAIAKPVLRCEQLYPSCFYPVFFIAAFEVSEMFASLRVMGKFIIEASRAAVHGFSLH